MDEEKEVKEKEKEKPAEDTGDGDKPAATTLIDDANSAAERLEKANERNAELLRQEEELEARKKLSGTAEAGVETKPQYSEEEKASRKRIKAVGDATGSDWAKKYE